MQELTSGFHFDTASLFASIIWGGIGTGYFVYGKKQRSAPALFGGASMIAICYFLASSALWMSLAAVGIMVGVYLWSREG